MKTRFFCMAFCLMFWGQMTQASTFTYHWEIDETPSGQESVSLPEPIEVEIEDSGIKASLSDGAATKLASKYKIFLSPQWDSEKAYLLLKTLNDMPTVLYNYKGFRPSYWILSDAHITHDIQFGIEVKGLKFVTIASEAFSYANPLMAKIDGVRGRFFSKRLHRAIVRYITDNGKSWLTKELLKLRYGVSVDIPDYVELTKHTTGEHAGRFDRFKPEELVAIISMLEEYPSGMVSTPGLKYLVRRLDGTPHPLSPEAAAVAWSAAGYIEFMESAFKGGITKYTQRLILHEKAHFLWHYLFDEQLKADWIELGGWFQEGDKWFTTKQTEFVSAYAHGVNPNEDMAESISYYIVNPNKLRSRSPAKYEFIQNRVMHGTRYISKIREDLTFEVYNLYPDYIYPGKIVSVDIKVEGEPEADKLVTVEIQTYTENELDHANYIDVQHCKNGDVDFHILLLPIDEAGNTIDKGYRFRGQTTVSKHLKSGHYVPPQITVGDYGGHVRHHSEKDYGWQLYIDNPLEDLHPPEYVPNSARLSLFDATTDKGEPYQIITATWQVRDDLGIGGYNVGILKDSVLETYSRFGHANIKSWENNIATMECNFDMPHYMPGGEYQLNPIYITDVASNTMMISFTDKQIIGDNWIGMDEGPAKITIETDTPDFQPPTLDLNRITINATPNTPESPDGETIVDISFYVKDNISGYNSCELSLRDPNGGIYSSGHYGGGLYFQGDPNVFRKYTETVVLPKGSIPGIWGLQEMLVIDKAGNRITHDFTEIVRFEVGEEPAAPSLMARLPQTTQLLANYPNPFNPETWIPYQLAKETEVTLQIYSVNGALIRTLALGPQPAGVYQTRSRAAYWNGRNEWGESVASGVYFYTLKTGDFTATRKLLIRK